MSKTLDVIDDLQKQFAEEFGPDPAPDHKLNHATIRTARTYDQSCLGCIAAEQIKQLKQHYGLLEPQYFSGLMTNMYGQVVYVNEKRMVHDEAKDDTGNYYPTL